MWLFLQDSLARGRASGIATEIHPRQPEVARAPFSTIAAAAIPSAERPRRRIALWVLPFVFVLYIINYLDRTSVAYAAIGMARDLGIDDCFENYRAD